MNHHSKMIDQDLIDEEDPCEIIFRLISPGWLFLLVAVVLFLIEITLISFLETIPQIPAVAKAGIDSFVSLCILSSGFYLIFYRPLKLYSDRKEQKNNRYQESIIKGAVSDTQAAEKTLALLSPKRLVPLMIISIFFAETMVMFILALLPPFSAPLEALFDASGLLIILSPTFYFFHYRPIQHHYLDRKRIIEKLSASEERLQLALQAVNDSLWDCNLATGEVYVSPRGEKMLGYEPGEIEPSIEAWRELLHPDEKEHVLALQRKHIEGDSSHYTIEHRLRCKNNGEWIWVLARGQVVSWDEEKRPLRMVGTHTDITQRKQAEESLRQSEVEIRTLSHKLIHNSEEEKKHLAQDFHDEFGQVLTAFQIGVEMLRDHRYEGENDYQFHCERLLRLVSRLEVDLRNICDQLRPVMLDDVGLVETLRWHIGEFILLDKSIVIDFSSSGDQHLSREVEIVLYRICQEALNNIAKHADAHLVKIELVLGPKQVSLSIQDDGQGMDEASFKNLNQASWGLGLLGMRERAAAVDGRLIVKSEIGKGTLVRAELPIKHTEVFIDAY